MNPGVAVILVNWNGKADTLACLNSLSSDSYQNKKIIAVDNGSVDGSVASIRSAFPEVEVIEAGENLGFTGGNNLGIRRAIKGCADYVFLLNNDTTVEPNAISELVRAAEQPPLAGILSPVIHYFDRPEETWFAGSQMDLSRGQAVHDNSSPPARDAAVKEIPWATGCAMLIPVDIVEHLNGFDERFFLNWEDVDLSLRVRKQGRPLLLVPSARIYHKVGRSFANASGSGTYYYARNQRLLLRLHGGNSYHRAYAGTSLTDLRRIGRSLRQREKGSLRNLILTIRAIKDDLLGRYGAVTNL